jgi:amino acid adenylation domain-containing protein/non-ribosomal peptide synthase protein (TIGR01720 family)
MSTAGRLRLSKERLALLDTLLRAEGIDRAPVRVVTPRPDPASPAPLTVQQTQMWFLDHLMTGSSPYVILGGLRVYGDFALDVFADACRQVVRRHESLRTVFVEVDGRPLQRVLAELPPEVTTHDLSGVPAEAAEAEVRRRQRDLAARPFDLATGPLLRVELLRLAPGKGEVPGPGSPPPQTGSGCAQAVVLFSMHHIVSDLWSMGVLMSELMELYAASTGGRTARLAPLPAQYPDFAVWQRGEASEAALRADLDYWVRQLRDAPPDTGLITDRPRPVEKTYRGASVPVELPPALASRVRELAKAEGATAFMVLAAAFTVLLARLSGGEDIVVGTPVAGRPLAELEPLIGYFVNTLALRTDASGNPTFRQLLRRVTRVCLDAFEHQAVPFDRVVEELRPDRSLSRNPLFQVMFVYQNAPLPGWDSGPVRMEPIALDAATAKFDLQLDLFEDGPSIWGRLVYSTDLFEDRRARDMATFLHRLLHALVTDPELRIAEVPLLDADERRELLARSRGPRVTPAPVGGLHELVAARASAHPDDLAVVSRDGRLTYAELDRRGNRLAHRLRAAGVGDESVVGLCLPTGADLITGMLGVWKAGAAYLPLDPDWPAERLDFMLTDSGAAAAVGRRDGEAALPERPVVWLDEVVRATEPPDGAVPGADLPDGPPAVAAAPDRLAYVMYTSGSTGRPKGVQVTHANLLSYLASVPGRVGLGEPGSRYALLQGAVTDFGNTIIFTSLVTGGELHILDRQTATDPDAVAEYLTRQRIDCAKLVPSHLAALSARVGAARLFPARTLVLGGEAASPRQVAELCEVAGDRYLANHYGPTETTIGVATTRLTPALLAGGFVPIGSPVGNTSLYVLDERLSPVPVGVAGELCVGGAQVARGYLNRPALTAERFVADPFAADGSTMYRTGDRVCWTVDGVLRFLGRVDDQLKIRGFRVEPREIEAVLAADAQVNRAVVLAREDTPGTRQLVAYVTAADPATALDPARLRALVARALPDHMVPAAVVVLDRLPLAANGKVDRAALPAPDFTAVACSRPPRTPTEKLLCEAFAQVLGLPEVGAEDGFFDLGGDSIQAIQLVSRARAAGLAFNTRDVFVHQSAAALAEVAAPVAERPPVVHDDGTGRVPATPVIERLRGLGARLSGYTHRVVVPVPPEADLAGLTAALRAVIDHHGALQARLAESADGAWSLLVGPPATVAAERCVRRVDVTGLDEAGFRRLLTAQSAGAVARIDPYAGAMVQAVWFDAGPGADGRLLLVIHHLVVDGVSWRVLLSDLRTAWETVTAGREVELPAVGTSLRRWAELLAAEAENPARVAELPVWQNIVRDAEPVVTGRHDPNGPVGELRLTLPAADAAPLLGRVPGAFRAGIQDVLLAAFGIAFSQWRRRYRGGPGAGVVEVEGHGRHQELAEGLDLTRTVGWFTSVYPVRLDPGALTREQVDRAGTELRDAVAALTGQLREVPADGLGFGLLRYLNPRTAAELAAGPTPQIVVNYLGHLAAPGGPARWEPLAGYAAEITDAAAGLSPLLTRPLHLNAYACDGPDGPELVADWSWAAPLWDADEVAALAQAWFAALRAIVACATRPGMALAAPAAPRERPGAAGGPGAISRVARDAPVPLSFAQLNNVHQPVGADNAHHNVITATVLHGELHEPALRRSLDRIAQRHEVLRTRILRGDAGWTQVVDPTGYWPLRGVDLRELDAAARSQALHRLIEEEETRPFVLAQGRPMRTTLVRLAEDEWVLLIVMHHIVIDPWGYGQLQRELAELYEADVVGREPRLPELEIQYPDFAAWQQKQLADGVLDEHLAYWRALLADLPAVPTFDAPAHQKTEAAQGYTRGFVLDEACTRALKDAARRCGVTLFMFLLSAYHALLASYTDSEDVSVCYPVAGRERPEIRHLIGYFISEVVVRTRVGWDATFRDLTVQVRDGTLNAHTYQQVPLRCLDGGVGAGYDPFRIMFNLVNYPPVPLDLHGLRPSLLTDVGDAGDDAVVPEVITAMKPHNLDLYLAMHEREGRLGGLWLYSPERIHPRVMAAIMRAWPVLLDLLVRHPGTTLGELRRRVWESTAAAEGGMR